LLRADAAKPLRRQPVARSWSRGRSVIYLAQRPSDASPPAREPAQQCAAVAGAGPCSYAPAYVTTLRAALRERSRTPRPPRPYAARTGTQSSTSSAAVKSRNLAVGLTRSRAARALRLLEQARREWARLRSHPGRENRHRAARRDGSVRPDARARSDRPVEWSRRNASSRRNGELCRLHFRRHRVARRRKVAPARPHPGHRRRPDPGLSASENPDRAGPECGRARPAASNRYDRLPRSASSTPLRPGRSQALPRPRSGAGGAAPVTPPARAKSPIPQHAFPLSSPQRKSQPPCDITFAHCRETAPRGLIKKTGGAALLPAGRASGPRSAAQRRNGGRFPKERPLAVLHAPADIPFWAAVAGSRASPRGSPFGPPGPGLREAVSSGRGGRARRPFPGGLLPEADRKDLKRAPRSLDPLAVSGFPPFRGGPPRPFTAMSPRRAGRASPERLAELAPRPSTGNRFPGD